jgi:hypothetical protein
MTEQQRCAIEFCVRLGKSGPETLQLIHQTHGDDAMRRAADFKWWKRFRDGETKVKNEPCSGLRQTVCKTFSRSGWRIVRSALLAKGGTSKKRPSSNLHKIPIPSNKVSPRNFQTALVNKNSWTILCYTILYYTILYYTILYYTILYFATVTENVYVVEEFLIMFVCLFVDKRLHVCSFAQLQQKFWYK